MGSGLFVVRAFIFNNLNHVSIDMTFARPTESLFLEPGWIRNWWLNFTPIFKVASYPVELEDANPRPFRIGPKM